MGPHPMIMNVLADERERLTQRTLAYLPLLTADSPRRHACETPDLRQVHRGHAGADPGPRRRTVGQAHVVGVLLIVLLMAVSAWGSASPEVAAWESKAGSGGSAHTSVAADCRTTNEMVMVLSGRIDRGIPPATPWCAAHC